MRERARLSRIWMSRARARRLREQRLSERYHITLFSCFLLPIPFLLFRIFFSFFVTSAALVILRPVRFLFAFLVGLPFFFCSMWKRTFWGEREDVVYRSGVCPIPFRERANVMRPCKE